MVLEEFGLGHRAESAGFIQRVAHLYQLQRALLGVAAN